MPSFVWDPDEAVENLRKHNVSFDAAIGVFDDPLALDEIDDREDYGEERSNIIGMAGGQLLVVSYTLRSGWMRIISARRQSRLKDEDIMAKSVKHGPEVDTGPLPAAQLERMVRISPVKRLRIELGLSQAEFSERFQIPVGTLRDWEQRRSEPDQAARAYLKLIAADPAFVERTLAAA